MIKRKILALFLLGAMALTACTGDSPSDSGTEAVDTAADTTADTAGRLYSEEERAALLSQYKVIRSSNAKQTELSAALAIKNALSLSIGDDWVKKGDPVPEDGIELLVGHTNRKASTDALETLTSARENNSQDYMIRMTDKKIVVIGVSPEATVAASDYFLAEVLPNLAEGMLEEYTYMYQKEYGAIRLNGRDISEYSLYVDEVSAKYLDLTLFDPLNKKVEDIVGVTLARSETKTSPAICFSIDTSLKAEESKIGFSGGDLLIRGGNFYSAENAFKAFTESLTDKTEWDSNYTADALYALPDRRPVPTEFKLGNSFEELLHYDMSSANPEEMLAKLPAGTLMAGETALLNAAKSVKKSNLTGSLVEVSGMPFTQAAHLEVTEAKSVNFAMHGLLKDKGTNGDSCMLKIYMRTVSGGYNNEGHGQVTVMVEESGGTYKKSLTATLSGDSEWQCFYAPFIYDSERTRVAVSVGKFVQVVELGGMEFYNFGKDVALTDLPSMEAIPPYLEPGAEWRREAWDRIEQIRMGDIKVTVKDASGKTVTNADVKLDMLEHEFQFGTAISGMIITNEELKGIYQQTLVENFNTVVPENQGKWATYEKDPQLSRDILKKAVEIGVPYARGHVLIWEETSDPRVTNKESVTAEVKASLDSRDAFQKTVKEHFEEIIEDLRPFIPYEWDVLNEAGTHHFYENTFGEDIAKEWYEFARAALGEKGILYYNEFDSSQETYDLIDRYFAMGCDIDGIGIQSHYAAPQDLEEIYELYNKMSKNGNRLKVTEYDFSNGNEVISADFTRDLLITAFSHEKMDGFILWNHRDRTPTDNKGILFEDDFTPKLGMTMWQDMIYNKWWTRESGKTNASGTFEVRGYYGNYEITVTANGKTVTEVVKLFKESDREIVITLP